LNPTPLPRKKCVEAIVFNVWMYAPTDERMYAWFMHSFWILRAFVSLEFYTVGSGFFGPGCLLEKIGL
jgi:hypothetical protein